MEYQQHMTAVSYTKSGIYQIYCLPENRYYVGSSQKVRSRILYHLGRLKRGTHRNFKLLKAWAQWGSNAFIFSLIERCPTRRLAIREAYWIKARKAATEGYNLTVQPYGFPTMSPEALIASSIRAKKWWTKKRRVAFGKAVSKRFADGLMPKRIFTKEQREKISAAHRGRPKSEEQKKKVSIAKTGIKTGPRDPKVCRKIARALKIFYRTHHGSGHGKKLTAEHRARISASNRRRVLNQKTRKKISNSIRSIAHLWKHDPTNGRFIKQGPVKRKVA